MICFKWYEVVLVFDFKKMVDGEISLFMVLKQQVLVFTKRAKLYVMIRENLEFRV